MTPQENISTRRHTFNSFNTQLLTLSIKFCSLANIHTELKVQIKQCVVEGPGPTQVFKNATFSPMISCCAMCSDQKLHMGEPTEPAPLLQEFRLRSHLIACNEMCLFLFLQPRPVKKIKVTDFRCIFLPSSSLRGQESNIRASALVIRLIWEDYLK